MRSPGSSVLALTASGPTRAIAHLALRIVDVGERQVPRDLTVHAERLHVFEDAVARALQHF